MKVNKLLIIGIILLASTFSVLSMTKSYLTDTNVITGNIISIGQWEELDIELKTPKDEKNYFLGQEIQILWKVHDAHPHSDFEFKLFLIDKEEEETELELEDLECSPSAEAPVYERWCKWEPEKTGEFKIRIEVEDENGIKAEDSNENFFTVKEKPGGGN